MSEKIAVIGSAGRKDDGKRINTSLYNVSYQDLVGCIDLWEVKHGVSGGAAFADHLVVRAYLENKLSDLTLYLPAYFEDGRFVANKNIRFNPGDTCNTYHEKFSSSCDIDSLDEIRRAIEKGAKVEVYEGFHRRNSMVAADCKYMIAYTFGTGGISEFTAKDVGFMDAEVAGLKDGGTAHTWGECWKATVKRHVNLGKLVKDKY